MGNVVVLRKFYLNLVGYKELNLEFLLLKLSLFYLNLVGYKVVLKDLVAQCALVLSELSGI